MSCLLDILLRFFFGWKWSDKISFSDFVMELLTVDSASNDIRGSLYCIMVITSCNTVGTPNKGTPNKGIFPYLTVNFKNGK